MSIKLVVSGSSKQSRIALVGHTGKELLASTTFTEPRAKGATLRALKKILGADVQIEDSTTSHREPAKTVAAVDTVAAKTAPVAPVAPAAAAAESSLNKGAATGGRPRVPRRPATASVGKTAAARKTTSGR